MVLDAIQRANDFAAARVAHAAHQAVARWNVELLRVEQIDALQSDMHRIFAKPLNGNVLIAPARSRLPNIPFALDRGGLGRSLRPTAGRQRSQGSSRGDRLEQFAA